MRKKSPRRQDGAQSNRVRIIGGQWRGSWLEFPSVAGLRPSSDRMRETLFNWLQPLLPGASCLDVCAGSGVLGFEAVSRGARHATLIDKDAAVVALLNAARQRFAAESEIEIVRQDAVHWLQQCETQFDLVFVDPPYDTGLYPALLQAMQAASIFHSHAHLFIEWGADQESPLSGLLDSGWELYRDMRTRHAQCALLRLTPSS